MLALLGDPCRPAPTTKDAARHRKPLTHLDQDAVASWEQRVRRIPIHGDRRQLLFSCATFGRFGPFTSGLRLLAKSTVQRNRSDGHLSRLR